MCGLALLNERYMVLVKEENGHKAFCTRFPEEAKITYKNLKTVSSLTDNFTVITNIYFGKGSKLREIILELNAESGLLGQNYPKWSFQQKFRAHFFIWQKKILRICGKTKFNCKVLTIPISS